MKPLFNFLVFALLANQLMAQSNKMTPVTTGKIDSLVDGWGNKTMYVGEIKNKNANGLGMASYTKSTAISYTGYFVNGKYEGKGVLFYTDGGFLTGTWKAGKLEGKGTHCHGTKELYVGNFVDGVKNGKGWFVQDDEGIIIADYKNNSYDGRMIYIDGKATTTNDNMYSNGKKDGQGYQYDLGNKKLFEGNWKNGTWEKATTGNYNTYLKSKSFTSQNQDSIIIMGITNDKGNLIDTAFYYDQKTKTRSFGIYKNAFLVDGIISVDKKSRFIGKFSDEGNAQGYCYNLSIDNFYDEGNYVNKYLRGNNCLTIDLKKKTIYYGAIIDTFNLTGKAWQGDANYLYNGNYKNGNFTGNGWRIDKFGYCLKGDWVKGEIVKAQSLTDENGQAVNLAPKTLSEALATIGKSYGKNYINSLKGQTTSIYPYLEWISSVHEGLLKLPGFDAKVYLEEDDDGGYYYNATYATTSSYAEAEKKYIELCNKLMATTVTYKKGIAAAKIKGEMKASTDNDAFTISEFSFPYDEGKYSNCYANVVIYKQDKEYKVILLCGNNMTDDVWEKELMF